MSSIAVADTADQRLADCYAHRVDPQRDLHGYRSGFCGAPTAGASL